MSREGNLVGDGDAISRESDNFARVIGEHTNVCEAEVAQDLRPDAAFMLHHSLASDVAIELTTPVVTDAGQRAHGGWSGIDTKSTAGVMQIDEDSAAFRRDSLERLGNDVAAIAAC